VIPGLCEMDISALVERRNFVEAMYYGGIQAMLNPSAQLHLCVGIACCAAIKPIAELERYALAFQKGESYEPRGSCLGVRRSTRLVSEGMEHFVAAIGLDPAIQVPESLREVAAEVLRDLADYARQDFKAFPASELPYTLREAAYAAVVLLRRLLPDMENEPLADCSAWNIEAGERLVEQRLVQQK